MKKQLSIYVGLGIFAVAGCAMLAGSYYFFASSQRFLKTGVSAQAEVIEMVSKRDSEGSYTYAPKFRFNAKDGTAIEVVSGESSNPPEFHAGEMVEVLYDPADPYSVIARTFSGLWLVSTILAGMGFVFLFPTVIGGAVVFRNKKRKSFLLEKGQRLSINAPKVILNTSFKMNGRSPFQIIAEWQNPTDQKIYTFKSEYIWFDPTKYVEGKSVTVLIDPSNPKVHYVDTSFLPKEA